MAMTDEQVRINNENAEKLTNAFINSEANAEMDRLREQQEKLGRGVNNPRKVHVVRRKVVKPGSTEGNIKVYAGTPSVEKGKAEAAQRKASSLSAILGGIGNDAGEIVTRKNFDAKPSYNNLPKEAQDILDFAQGMRDDEHPEEVGSFTNKAFFDIARKHLDGSDKVKNMLNWAEKSQKGFGSYEDNLFDEFGRVRDDYQSGRIPLTEYNEAEQRFQSNMPTIGQRQGVKNQYADKTSVTWDNVEDMFNELFPKGNGEYKDGVDFARALSGATTRDAYNDRGGNGIHNDNLTTGELSVILGKLQNRFQNMQKSTRKAMAEGDKAVKSSQKDWKDNGSPNQIARAILQNPDIASKMFAYAQDMDLDNPGQFINPENTEFEGQITKQVYKDMLDSFKKYLKEHPEEDEAFREKHSKWGVKKDLDGFVKDIAGSVFDRFSDEYIKNHNSSNVVKNALEADDKRDLAGTRAANLKADDDAEKAKQEARAQYLEKLWEKNPEIKEEAEKFFENFQNQKAAAQAKKDEQMALENEFVFAPKEEDSKYSRIDLEGSTTNDGVSFDEFIKNVGKSKDGEESLSALEKMFEKGLLEDYKDAWTSQHPNGDFEASLSKDEKDRISQEAREQAILYLTEMASQKKESKENIQFPSGKALRNAEVSDNMKNLVREELLPTFKGYEGLKGTSAGTTSDKRMKNICEGISWGVGY